MKTKFHLFIFFAVLSLMYLFSGCFNPVEEDTDYHQPYGYGEPFATPTSLYMDIGSPKEMYTFSWSSDRISFGATNVEVGDTFLVVVFENGREIYRKTTKEKEVKLPKEMFYGKEAVFRFTVKALGSNGWADSGETELIWDRKKSKLKPVEHIEFDRGELVAPQQDSVLSWKAVVKKADAIYTSEDWTDVNFRTERYIVKVEAKNETPYTITVDAPEVQYYSTVIEYNFGSRYYGITPVTFTITAETDDIDYLPSDPSIRISKIPLLKPEMSFVLAENGLGGTFWWANVEGAEKYEYSVDYHVSSTGYTGTKIKDTVTDKNSSDWVNFNIGRGTVTGNVRALPPSDGDYGVSAWNRLIVDVGF